MKEYTTWKPVTEDNITVLENTNDPDIVVAKPVSLIRRCAKNCKHYDTVEECAEKLVEILLANKQP